MSVKIPENDLSAQEPFAVGNGNRNSLFYVAGYNLTLNAMLVKSSTFNSVVPTNNSYTKIPHLYLRYEVSFATDTDLKWFEPKYPMDAYIIELIKTEMLAKQGSANPVKEIQVAGSIYISEKNFAQWASKSDGGIHSELFAKSYYITFGNQNPNGCLKEYSKPSNFNSCAPRNSKGEFKENGAGSSIEVQYKCTSKHPVDVHTTACGEQLTVTSEFASDGENLLTITVFDDEGEHESKKIQLPCFRREYQKHMATLEENGFFLDYSTSLNHANSKSLQRSESIRAEMIKEIQILKKTITSLNSMNEKLNGKLEKLKEDKAAAAKKHDKESALSGWAKEIVGPILKMVGQALAGKMGPILI